MRREKFEEGKIRGRKNSRREKFGEEFKERKKSGSKKEKRLHKTRGGKSLEKDLKSVKNRELKNKKNPNRNSKSLKKHFKEKKERKTEKKKTWRREKFGEGSKGAGKKLVGSERDARGGKREEER